MNPVIAKRSITASRRGSFRECREWLRRLGVSGRLEFAPGRDGHFWKAVARPEVVS